MVTKNDLGPQGERFVWAVRLPDGKASQVTACAMRMQRRKKTGRSSDEFPQGDKSHAINMQRELNLQDG
jgi:hypothetical protein